MKIVAFLQNQWFKDPESIRRMYERYPDRRESLNRIYLFMGCLTGKRLRSAFGDLCDEIIWENCTAEIGGQSSANFPPDPEHIRRVLEKHNPEIVLAFGRNAEDSVNPIWANRGRILSFPHPAARHLKNSDLTHWAQRLADSIALYH